MKTAAVTILEYNGGNSESVRHALDRIGVSSELTSDPDRVARAERLIFPGVGEARSTMRFLNERGLAEALRGLRCPMLGICLGMQLFCAHSEENDVECLGLFPYTVRRFRGMNECKVPHMGWNSLHELGGRLFRDVDIESYVYFVHSYFVPPRNESSALSWHGEPFSAALEKDNVFAVQFHPEKSAAVGERILKNFLAI